MSILKRIREAVFGKREETIMIDPDMLEKFIKSERGQAAIWKLIAHEPSTIKDILASAKNKKPVPRIEVDAGDFREKSLPAKVFHLDGRVEECEVPNTTTDSPWREIPDYVEEHYGKKMKLLYVNSACDRHGISGPGFLCETCREEESRRLLHDVTIQLDGQLFRILRDLVECTRSSNSLQVRNILSQESSNKR